MLCFNMFLKYHMMENYPMMLVPFSIRYEKCFKMLHIDSKMLHSSLKKRFKILHENSKMLHYRYFKMLHEGSCLSRVSAQHILGGYLFKITSHNLSPSPL